MAVILGAALLTIGLLFFLLRGPYLSNYIKRILIPVLENATRERIIIDKAVINLFPFYVQAKGFKVFDKNGEQLLWITKSRAYIDLLGLLSKEIRVRKLTLIEPDLVAGENDLQRIMKQLKKSGSFDDEGEYSVSVKNIKLTDGSVVYRSGDGKYGFSGRGLYADMGTIRNSSNISVHVKNGAVQFPNNSELAGSIDGKAKVDGTRIEIAELNIRSSKSSFSTEGEMVISKKGRIKEGNFTVQTEINGETVADLFNLKGQRNGVLSIEGPVKLSSRKKSKLPKFRVDLKTEGTFFLETLMELLDVKENISGKVTAQGTIQGVYPKIVGKGTGRLEHGMFDTLPIDDAEGAVKYKNKKFSLSGVTAHTFGGNMAGKAHIVIPEGDFGVAASISNINSPRFFQYIQWEPPFPEGKIDGVVELSHDERNGIDLSADLRYQNTVPGEGDVLERLISAKTDLMLRGDTLWLYDTVLSTSRSDLFIDGMIDLEEEALNLSLDLSTVDAEDLTSPYYTELQGPLSFAGVATGPAADPFIVGTAEAEAGSVEGMQFSSAHAEVEYRISFLSVNPMVIYQDDASYTLSGTIDFRESEELFTFRSPFYRVKAELMNVDISPYIKNAFREIPVSGLISGLASFEGDFDEFISTGDLVLNDSEIYGEKVDTISVDYILRPEEIEFRSLKAERDKTNLETTGTLYFNKDFNITAAVKNMRLSEFPNYNDCPVDVLFDLDISGNGSIDNPDLKFSANITESSLRGVQAGEGEITGTLKDRKLNASGSFIDGLITADAHAFFRGNIPWDVDAAFKEGRYDFLLEGYMKEVPEDFSLSLQGSVKLEGQGDAVSAKALFPSGSVSLYGYNFTNREAIDVQLADNVLTVNSLSMSGKNADWKTSGMVKLYESYDLRMDGNLDIAPLRALNDNIDSLRGRGQFGIDLDGQWENPEMNGEVNIIDATGTLSDFAYTIGPVAGTFYLKKDRIVFESVNSKFAGGSVVMSGAAYLDHLSLKRFFMSADIEEIKIKPVEGLNTSLAGELFYETSSKGSVLTGNIDILKARYTKRTEWKSWLLGLREIKEEENNYPEFLAGTKVNVHVRGGENITVDNNIARTQVEIALNLVGTLDKKGLLGRIEADEGTVYFRSNEFEIREGSSVDFVDTANITPFFHILADSYIGDYYVRLILDGTMDNFTLSLFSDPPLEETEILALLTVGQTGKDRQGIDSGIAAGEAAAMLTGGLQDTVEEEFKYVTGFERFEIEPHTTTEGAFVPKVTIGKRLFEDKLFVTYSSAIGTAEEDVIKLEYKVDRNISVVGSRNEIGSAGVDLKYRFEFK